MGGIYLDFVLRRTRRKEGGRWSVDDWLFVSTLGKMSSTQQKKKRVSSFFFCSSYFLLNFIGSMLEILASSIFSNPTDFHLECGLWAADSCVRPSKRGSQQPPPSRKDPRPSSSRIIISFFLISTLMKKVKKTTRDWTKMMMIELSSRALENIRRHTRMIIIILYRSSKRI